MVYKVLRHSLLRVVKMKCLSEPDTTPNANPKHDTIAILSLTIYILDKVKPMVIVAVANVRKHRYLDELDDFDIGNTCK